MEGYLSPSLHKVIYSDVIQEGEEDRERAKLKPVKKRWGDLVIDPSLFKDFLCPLNFHLPPQMTSLQLQLFCMFIINLSIYIHKKSNDQTNIDKYRVAADITDYHII